MASMEADAQVKAALADALKSAPAK
jgi:hypothetical protein